MSSLWQQIIPFDIDIEPKRTAAQVIVLSSRVDLDDENVADPMVSL